MASNSTSTDGSSAVEPEHVNGPHEDKRCRKCKKINTKRLIECSSCNSQYHRTCINITGAQASQIARFLCHQCHGGLDPVIETPINDIPVFDLLQHLKTCRKNLSLIGIIPKGARITAADALNDLIVNVIQSNNPHSWEKLLCFTYHGLQKPKKKKLIKSRIRSLPSSAQFSPPRGSPSN